MSYDLFFVRDRAKGTLTRDETDRAFARRAHFERAIERGETTYVYENVDTEVYFTFALGEPDDEPGEKSQRNGGSSHVSTGLSFNMPYCRPSFFATEAMPVVVEIAKALELSAIDPQIGSAGGGEPQAVEAASLEKTWHLGNEFALSSIGMKVEGEAHEPEDGIENRFAPRETLDAWWRTMAARRALQRRVREGLYVPRVLLLARRAAKWRDRSSDVVRRAIAWTPGTPLVLVDTDLVHLARPEPGRLVPVAAVREMLGARLVAMEGAHIYDGGDRAEVERLAAAIPGDAPSAFVPKSAHLLFDIAKPSARPEASR